MRFWSQAVRKMTRLDARTDIQQPYTELIVSLSEQMASRPGVRNKLAKLIPKCNSQSRNQCGQE